ncbi:hypothetical protein ACO0M4_17105 [Streptomyces sp. RGM 3693]|uniref:hypothetical protein n=1 Tax=Streptomyces sp. RGM 3693 TaxID=3413284 RepID=UPI003D2C51DF
MRRTTPALALGLCALLATSVPAQATPDAAKPIPHDHIRNHGYSYSTKASYEPRQDPGTYQPAPHGFVPVFTENVSRHGSGAATDSKDGDLILRLWDQARKSGQLTVLG